MPTDPEDVIRVATYVPMTPSMFDELAWISRVNREALRDLADALIEARLHREEQA